MGAMINNPPPPTVHLLLYVPMQAEATVCKLATIFGYISTASYEVSL